MANGGAPYGDPNAPGFFSGGPTATPPTRKTPTTVLGPKPSPESKTFPAPSGPFVSGLHVGGVNIDMGMDVPTTAEKSRIQQERREADEAFNMATDALNYYRANLKPRLQSRGGQPGLGIGGWQGFAYAYPNLAQKLGYPVDHDVGTYFTKLGGLATKMTGVYARGRAGPNAFRYMTTPHIPTPPTQGLIGGLEALGTVNFDKWEEQLSAARTNLGILTGRVKARTYPQLPPDHIRLPSGRWYSPSTGQVYEYNDE
jgi:hypothetical protein